MNLTQIKYFQAVCEYGSVAEASKQIHISPPSISTAIKMLEEEYGLILFRRTRAGMEQTNAGRKLHELSKGLMKNIDNINRIMGDEGDGSKQLRIGIPPMVSVLILPDIVTQYGEEYPDVHLQVDTGGRREVFKRLSDGELDVAILPVNCDLDPIYCRKKVGSVEICAIVAKDAVPSGLRAFDIYRLSEQKLILFQEDFLHKELLLERFRAIQKKPDIFIQTSQLSTILRLVRDGDGTGFVLREIIEDWMPVKPIPLEPAMNLDICMIWRKDDFMFQTMQDFIFLIEKCV